MIGDSVSSAVDKDSGVELSKTGITDGNVMEITVPYGKEMSGMAVGSHLLIIQDCTLGPGQCHKFDKETC